MKKSVIKCAISLFLSFTLIVGLQIPLALFSFAETNSFQEHIVENTFAGYYFNNLSNMAENIAGSCSLIALEMLLTYYDCYWDDRLVLDQHMYDDDTNLDQTMASSYVGYSSPGSRDAYSDETKEHIIDLYGTPNNLDAGFAWNAYKSAMLDTYEYSLHAFLSTIALGENMFLATSNNASLFSAQAGEILEKYLDWACDVWEEEWQVTCYDFFEYQAACTNLGEEPMKQTAYSNYLREMVVESLRAGIPVHLSLNECYIMGELEAPGRGHAVVAYAYDEVTDSIYVHNGYPEEDDRFMEYRKFCPTQEIDGEIITTTITGFVQMVPLGDHVHSSNYFFSDFPEGACACELPSHQHLYGNSMTPLGASGHNKTCHCGYVHTFQHEYTNYIPVGESGHSILCLCGYAISESHKYKAQGLTKKVCVDCGHTQIISPDTPIVSPLHNDTILPNENMNEERKN